MITTEEFKSDYNWREAVSSVSMDPALPISGVDLSYFSIEDVEEVFHASEGWNDEEHWIAVVRLKDGRFVAMNAWCDYTGWDWQSGGEARVASSYNEIIRFGLSDDERNDLGITLND